MLALAFWLQGREERSRGYGYKSGRSDLAVMDLALSEAAPNSLRSFFCRR
jgi:hypothetical protein